MKKYLLAAFIFSFFSLASKAQLENTRWRNTLNVPDPIDCEFVFKKDTLEAYTVANGQMIEAMSYKLSKDTLRIVKISGTSPCSDVVGIYKAVLKDNQLTITPIDDPCVERSGAFRPEPWIRVQQKP